MTEFTKEYIKSVRMCSYLIEPPASEVVGSLCDHIERLQARVQELEQERQCEGEGMTEFTKDDIEYYRKQYALWTSRGTTPEELHLIGRLRDALDHIEHLHQRIAELEVQLKSKDIIINNQQGRLNYYATKDLLGGKNEHG